jgi:hypothetical protein
LQSKGRHRLTPKTGTTQVIFEISADGLKGESRFGVLMLRIMAVRTSGPAGLGASTQRVVDDGLDGARATAALGAATEAPVDLLGIAGKVLRTFDGNTDVVVAQHVAGTDNH